MNDLSPARWAAAGVLAALTTASAQPVPAPSGVRFEPPVVDFGPVYAHQPARGEVLVFNDGPGEIRLDEIGRSCAGCLEVFPDKDRLAPGDVAALSLWFDPGGTPGEAREFLVLDPDTPSPRTQVLQIRASVLPAYRIDGGSLLMEASGPLDAVSGGVWVSPLFPMKGRLASGRSLGGHTRVQVTPHADAPSAYQVCVTALTPVASGWTEDEILLESSDPADPPFRMPASVFLMPPIHVYPARLLVAPIRREQLRILFIETPTGEPVELVSAEAPKSHARLEYFPGYGLERSRLNVYVSQTQGLEGELGEITLRLRGSEEKTVRIPVVVDPTQKRRTYFTQARVPLGSRKGCDCGS